LVEEKPNSEDLMAQEDTQSNTEFDVNKNLGRDACEVTKETFFKDLYNPAEKDSSKKYKLRRVKSEKKDAP
jgi:hypothetical protein